MVTSEIADEILPWEESSVVNPVRLVYVRASSSMAPDM